MTNAEQRLIEAYGVECTLNALRSEKHQPRQRWLARANAIEELKRRLYSHADACKAQRRLPNEAKSEHRARLAQRERLTAFHPGPPPAPEPPQSDSIGNPRRTEAARKARLMGAPRRPPYPSSSSDQDNADD